MRGLDSFVPPRPSKALIRLMTGVNRVFMLKGVPGLRDLWPLKKVPPFRGVTNVRHLDFPAEDENRLKAVCGRGKATFITPNHPEFFTDWMIDKEVIARVSPLAASWATHSVVNGLGRLAQRFWLANNLIAQIPGNGAPARAYSEAWALQGHGVLLHPEGGVGWHCNFVAPLLAGAVEMALECLEQGRKTDPGFEAWVAPVVWKLAFTEDVERELHAECAYIERRLRVSAKPTSLPERIYAIYETLLTREGEGLGVDGAGRVPFAERQASVCKALTIALAAALEVDLPVEADELLRAARRKLRDMASRPEVSTRKVKDLAARLGRIRRIGAFAFANGTLTQEELAEHLKRIRNDYCAGSLRDTLNRFVPQPAGPRRAHIRVPEPIAIHQHAGSQEEALQLLRRRMQDALDAINAELAVAGGQRHYQNPFWHPPARQAIVEAAG